MTQEILGKLLEYIDARIDERSVTVQCSSDGGLVESMHRRNVETELREMLDTGDTIKPCPPPTK